MGPQSCKVPLSTLTMQSIHVMILQCYMNIHVMIFLNLIPHMDLLLDFLLNMNMLMHILMNNTRHEHLGSSTVILFFQVHLKVIMASTPSTAPCSTATSVTSEGYKDKKKGSKAKIPDDRIYDFSRREGPDPWDPRRPDGWIATHSWLMP